MGRDVDLFCVDGGPFTDFGPSAFLPRRRPCRRMTIDDDFRAMRRAIRTDCPGTAGVYGFLDRDGRLIYVGVSRRLRKRLVTYFQRGEVYRKERRIAAHASEVVWEEIGHEFAAQLRELELIRRHEPRLNVRGREHGRKLGYIYLTGDEAPRFRVGRHRASIGAAVVGTDRDWLADSRGGGDRQSRVQIVRLPGFGHDAFRRPTGVVRCRFAVGMPARRDRDVSGAVRGLVLAAAICRAGASGLRFSGW